MDDLLDHAPCGFLSLADDGTVLAANATLLDLLGHEREVLLRQHVDALLTPGARIFYQTHVFPLLRLHGRADEIYLSLRAADGRDVPVLLNAARREREGVATSDWVVVPMHQRSRFEDELLQAKKVAEEASQARSRFLSMMSHDLRSPLSAISITAQVLRRGGSGPVTDDQERDLRRIEAASQYVLGMIGDMLTYARMETGRLVVRSEPVVLESALQRAEALIVHQVEEAGLTFERTACGPALAVRADPDRLQQILLNLLTNAIKFTESEGRVWVTCERAGSHVLIRVHDTGRGIPSGDLDRIFDPFAQVDEGPDEPTRAGVGLGLAISRDLARAMDGDVTVESAPGEGSVFTVTLPVADGE